MDRAGAQSGCCSHAHAHTLTRTHTTHAHTHSRPLGTSANEGGGEPGLSRPDPGKAGAACVRTGAPPQGRAERVPHPPGPLCLRREPGAMQACPRPLPPPPRVPGLLPEGRGRRRGSRRWLLWPRLGPGPAQPGSILFPFPLRNALTRRLLKKSCRKSILSRDCPQTRLDFY